MKRVKLIKEYLCHLLSFEGVLYGQEVATIPKLVDDDQNHICAIVFRAAFHEIQIDSMPQMWWTIMWM